LFIIMLIATKVKSFFFSLFIGIITMCIVLSFLHLLKKTQFTMQQFSKPHIFAWIKRVGMSKCKNIIVKNEHYCYACMQMNISIKQGWGFLKFEILSEFSPIYVTYAI
jgi:hypothetical protein